MKIETLFLDAGGVIVDPNWERVSAALLRHGVDAPAEALRAAEPHVKLELDQPAAIERSDDASRGTDLFHLVLERLRVERSPATDAALDEIRGYHTSHNLWEVEADGARQALADLREAGLRLVVVSNANGTVSALFERLDLARFFDVVIDSAEEKVEKPDPEIFRIALARSGAEPRRTLHAGDLYEVDVAGARSALLAAVLIDRYGLYAGRDCPRFPSLGALAKALLSGRRAVARQP